VLRIIVEHNRDSGYLVDVECDKPVRWMGSNITGIPSDILDIIEDVIYDYRQD